VTATDPSLAFWLRYLEASGGLHEDADDQVLVVLPSQLQTELGLPEEVAVTADPEVAREDGALLLLPGHPLLDQAAASVLDRSDAGVAWLAWPEGTPPAPAALLERAGERFDIDHGRIDAGGHPARVYLPVLRVGALVSYIAGPGERFQEREEVWVDGRTGLPLGQGVMAAVTAASRLPVPDTSHRALTPDLAVALARAHERFVERALDRLDVLARRAQAPLREELAQTDAYYQAALEAIAKRREQAEPDRQQLLGARAEATRSSTPAGEPRSWRSTAPATRCGPSACTCCWSPRSSYPYRCAAARPRIRSRSPGSFPAPASSIPAARTAGPPSGWWRAETGWAAASACNRPARPRRWPHRQRPPRRRRLRRHPHHPPHRRRRGRPRPRPPHGRAGSPPVGRPGHPLPRLPRRPTGSWSGRGESPTSCRQRSGRQSPAANAGRASRWCPARP